MSDFTSINYLQAGNPRQQAAFDILIKHAIMTKLSNFRPLLAGTVPIAIDVPGSDLDILCYVPRPGVFVTTVKKYFSAYPEFELSETVKNHLPTIICRFSADGVPIELFGQNVLPARQPAFRHMLIEYRIMQLKGNAFRNGIMTLKRQGVKTEPAFARLLQLQGDPYEALLDLEVKNNELINLL